MPGRVELPQPVVELDAAGTSGHGPHPHAPVEGYEAVAWRPVTGQGGRSRALLWTCRSCPPVYYLHLLGVSVVIERATDGESAVTGPMTYQAGRDLWTRILHGTAR